MDTDRHGKTFRIVLSKWETVWDVDRHREPLREEGKIWNMNNPEPFVEMLSHLKNSKLVAVTLMSVDSVLK